MYKLFCYGSLNQKMIEALTGEKIAAAPQPGILKNHIRIFAKHSEYWKGAVASVYPCKGKKVYGAIVELTKKQMQKIDEYEGDWYRKVKRKILSGDSYVYCTLYEIIEHNFVSHPSNRYINSIRTTLKDVGYASQDSIPVFGVFQTGEKQVVAKVVA